MATVSFTAGKTVVTTKVRTRAHAVAEQLANIPGGLYPLRMAHWQTDAYRVHQGWPVSIPELDVKARSLASADGVVLSYRESARSLQTNALSRWIADNDLYDTISLQWFPVHAVQPVVWETATDYAPTFIDEYEYRSGKDLLFRDVLNFDSDSYEHMWTNLNTTLGGTAGYSVIFVGSLNSVYGSNTDVPYSGLWSVGQPTPAVGEEMSEVPSGGWFELSLQDSALYLETDQTPRVRVLGVANLLAQTAPMMVAISFSRPNATIYAGTGPSGVLKATVYTGEDTVALDGNVVLGRTNGDILHTSDMALMDLGLYPGVLTPNEVLREFSLLSSVYGGDIR